MNRHSKDQAGKSLKCPQTMAAGMSNQ